MLLYGVKLSASICSASDSWAAAQDPFGNYVVQYVLELGHPEATAAIMRQLCGHYADLAQQKFSSNVVEKCLKLGGSGLAELRERVIRELLSSPVLHRLLQVTLMLNPSLNLSSSLRLWSVRHPQAAVLPRAAPPAAGESNVRSRVRGGPLRGRLLLLFWSAAPSIKDLSYYCRLLHQQPKAR